MIKTFCDRCGKEYTREYSWLRNTHYYTVSKLVGSLYSKKEWSMDDSKYICPKCVDSYIHWFMHPEDDIEGE